MKVEMSEEFIERLKRLAQRETWTENAEKDGELMNPSEYSGGNFDDAYYGGQSDGETEMAQEVLDHLGISYKDD